VLRFDNAASKSNGATADGVLGQPDFVTSTGGAAAANNFGELNGVAVDHSGNLWVTDAGFNRLLRFNNAAGKANGANADGVLGQTSFTTGASGLSASSFNTPYGVAADNTGHLWVTDFFNKRVLRFDNAAGKPNGANADGVLGQPNFVSNAGTTTQNGMNFPIYDTTDTAGTLWVSDYQNNRVLGFNNAAGKSNGANADGVLGQLDFVSNAAATTQNGLNFALGLAVDSSNNLWVADSNNNRALYFINKDAATATPTATSTNTATSTPTNQYSYLHTDQYVHLHAEQHGYLHAEQHGYLHAEQHCDQHQYHDANPFSDRYNRDLPQWLVLSAATQHYWQ